MNKSEVYSWRIAPNLKAALEEAARQEQQPLSLLLERIVAEWLALKQLESSQTEAEQQRLQQAAVATFGALNSADPDRSSHTRQRLQAKLRQHYARQSTD